MTSIRHRLGLGLAIFSITLTSAIGQEAARQTTPSVPDSWSKGFQWRNVGPANMGGRITALSVYEKDPSIWWAATASGGLLKTTNNGVTFEHQFTHEATVSIGDVAVAQSDPNIIYVGTGEQNPRNSASWGDGIYKSTDGGKTWKNIGIKKGFQTGRVVVHPTDPKTVYVGVMGRLWGTNEERGLYKTTDGGDTWNKILYIDDKTGAIEVQMKPGDPETLLVAMYERQRDGFDTNEPAKRNGPGSGLHKTTDGGKTWTRITKGLPEGALGRMGLEYYRKDPNTVFLVVESEKTGNEPPNAPYLGLRGTGTETDVGAKLTEITKDSPAEKAGLKSGDVVIAVNGTTIHGYDGTGSFMAEIRKRSAGDTVKLQLSREKKIMDLDVQLAKRPDPATRQRARDGTGRRTDDTGGAGPFSSGLGGQRGNLTEQQGPDGHQYGGVYKSTDGGDSWSRINSINPRPMYFSQVRVDPSDDTYMWILGVSLARSKDSGKSFTDDGGRGTHADHHALWVDPKDGRHMILGNDGGIYTTYDRGDNWDHLNHVAIGQFYHVAVDPRPNYMIYGGLQDNGSWGGPSRSRAGRGPINEDWISVGGGDGFVCRVDPNDPDQVYYESQGGAMGRFNFRTGERGSIRPQSERGLRYRWNWKTPFALSTHNSRIFYAAGNHVFRSVDQGRTMKRISDEFTRTRRGSGTALAESPLDSDVLYVGSDDGALLTTRDGGITWYKHADFPLSDEEKNAIARIEESESGGGTGGSPPGGATPPPGGATPGAAEPATPAETPTDPAKPTDPDADPSRPTPSPAGASPAPTPDQPAAQPERPPGRGPRGEGRASFADRLKQMDANKDGKVAKDEVPEQMRQMFDRADANQDGALDESEITAIAQRAGGGGGQGGGRGGRAGQTERPSGFTSDAPRTGGKLLSPEPLKSQPEAPATTSPDDAITGDWTGKPVSIQEMPGGVGDFTLSLTLAQDGKVSGVYTTEGAGAGRGGGDLSNGKFDKETGALTASIEAGRTEIDLKAKLADGKLTGELDVAGGRFQIAFTAERTSKTPTGTSTEPGVTPGGKSLLELLPGPRWVSSIEASRFARGRVYATFDGHRSNDDEPYVFASDDYGRSWRSIRGNLPTTAGSTKVIREDLVKENLLYLGTEFGAYVSVDSGKSWTRFNNNLPTVAVHEFAVHPTTGELIVATHGRSIWIVDITPLRQMSESTAGQLASLYGPRNAVYWRPDPRRGGDNRRFVGENDDTGAVISYSLSRRPRTITLQISDLAGEVIRDLEPKAEPGLHRIVWDLRRSPEPGRVGAPTAAATPGGRAGGGGGGGGGGAGGGFGGARGGRLVAAGTYRIALKVDGEVFNKTLTVQGDPQYPDYQPWERAGGFGGDEDEQEEEEHDLKPLDRDD
jgi:photosystem II stability/assembly factor-like uncharacterized protein